MKKRASVLQVALATAGLAVILAATSCTEAPAPTERPPEDTAVQELNRQDRPTPTPPGRAERPTPTPEGATALSEEGSEQRRPRPTYRTFPKSPTYTPTPTPDQRDIFYRDRVRNSCSAYKYELFDSHLPNVGFLATSEDLYGFTVQWSADAKSIILDNRGRLIRADSDGSRLESLAHANPWGESEDFYDNSAFGFHGHLSHDGKKLVYATCEFKMDLPKGRPTHPQDGDYNYEIAVKDLETGEVNRLTSNADTEIHPVWSPDSSMIAYLGDPDWLGKPASVIVVDPAGNRITSLRNLKPDQYGEDSTLLMLPPAWSPDGTKVAYKLEEGLGILDISTGTTQMLRSFHAVPGWAPNGNLLASTKQIGNLLYLVITDLQGQVLEKILNLTTFDSPRERRYSSGEKRYNREGHNLIQLVNSVKWSPDGRHLLYRCPMGICVVDMDWNLIATTPEEYQSLEDQHWYAAWSPDGSRLAARKDSFPQEAGSVFLYTMNPDGSHPRVLVRGGLGLLPENTEYETAEQEAAACQGHLVAEPDENPGLVADCMTLLKARGELTPEGIVNWHPSVPMELWAGVTVSGEPLRVREISLTEVPYNYFESVALTSLIPDEVAFMDGLEVLRVHAFSMEEDATPEQYNGLVSLKAAAEELTERLWNQPNLRELELLLGIVEDGVYAVSGEDGFKR